MARSKLEVGKTYKVAYYNVRAERVVVNIGQVVLAVPPGRDGLQQLNAYLSRNYRPDLNIRESSKCTRYVLRYGDSRYMVIPEKYNTEALRIQRIEVEV